MFFHCFKYSLKTVLRNKAVLIWTLIFPLALGTFMYMAFGNIYKEDIVFDTLQVAVVERNKDLAFDLFTEMMSQGMDGEKPLISAVRLSEQEAKDKLAAGELDAVFIEDEKISLAVSKSDIPQEIARVIVGQYNKTKTFLVDAITEKPEETLSIIRSVMTTVRDYSTEIKIASGNQDPYTNFFYAIVAMSCFFSAYGACEFSENMTVSASDLGKRRSVTHVSKGHQAIASFLSMWLVQIIVEIISVGYFIALGINMGDKLILLLPVIIAGTAVGLSLGILFGSIPKMAQSAKITFCTLISMTFCVMSDLCVGGIKNAVEKTFPLLNRINPAVLISDSFYALNVFDTYERYIRNIAILSVIAVVMLAVSFILLRREKA